MKRYFNSDMGICAILFSLVVVSFPVFSLIIRGWVSGVLFCSCLLAIALCVQKKVKLHELTNWLLNGFRGFHDLNTYIVVLFFAFFLPLLSVFFSQAFNGHWNMAKFDSPSRYMLSLIVLLTIARFKNVVGAILEFIFPLSAYLTLLCIPFLPKTSWTTESGRMTNHFIDPLIFGEIALVFGVLSLLSINLNGRRNWLINGYKILGAIIGIYLSLMSQSRTGWLAIPIIFLIWFSGKFKKSRLKAILLAVVLTISVGVVAYQSSNIVQSRIDSLTGEISGYHWDSINENTSVGARISWIRIGFHYFSLRPLFGWGDEDLAPHINDPEIVVYANKETRDQLLQVGFHSDYIANMVHYGVLGLVSTILIFLAPLLIFIYCIQKNLSARYAMLGLSYVLIQAVSSLSYHVLDFKFVASFYGLMIAVIVGVILNQCSHKKVEGN